MDEIQKKLVDAGVAKDEDVQKHIERKELEKLAGKVHPLWQVVFDQRGKIQVLLWIKTGKLPRDHKNICSICGKYCKFLLIKLRGTGGREPQSKISIMLTSLLKKFQRKFGEVDLFICKQCLHTIKEITLN